jgi:alkylation response protein AidB-like acyl-CoA dehydrogenase
VGRRWIRWQRDLPQGELFSTMVRIPNKYMFVDPENYSTWTANNLAFGNAAMTLFAIGLRVLLSTRRSRIRRRGSRGKLLIDHYFTKVRIGRMFGKVEAIRATSRAVWNLALKVYPPLPEYSTPRRPSAPRWRGRSSTRRSSCTGRTG